jgi:opacity protein-like surface antigen
MRDPGLEPHAMESQMTRLLLALSLALVPAAATADGAFTARAMGGASAVSSGDLAFASGGLDEDLGTGIAVSGAIGYDYAGSPWRTEIEFAYRSINTDAFDGDYASTVLMVNGFYDFPTSGRLTPYLGIGLGYVTEIDLDVESGPAIGEYSDRGGVAAQVMAGASYALTDRWALDGELRYFDAGSRRLTTDGGASVEADYSAVEALIGLRFRF